MRLTFCIDQIQVRVILMVLGAEMVRLDILPRLKPWDSLYFDRITDILIPDIAVLFRIFHHLN